MGGSLVALFVAQERAPEADPTRLLWGYLPIALRLLTLRVSNQFLPDLAQVPHYYPTLPSRLSAVGDGPVKHCDHQSVP